MDKIKKIFFLKYFFDFSKNYSRGGGGDVVIQLIKKSGLRHLGQINLNSVLKVTEWCKMHG